MKIPQIVPHSRRLLDKPYFPYLILILIATICYLPLAAKLGFYNDDWYLIYAGTSQGSTKFIEVFEIDRPLRGYLVGFLFDLFGTNVFLYSLSAFLVRCLGSFGLFWMLRHIWPQSRLAAYLAALWLVIYPGFLDQPNAIDYQSHLFSFTLAIFSLYFSIRALFASKWWATVGMVVLAVLLQLAYLGLMEYYIGLEGLRLLLIGYVVFRSDLHHRLSRLLRLIIQSLPTTLFSLVFLVWRTFFFTSQRQATNVGSMLTDIAGSPALRILWMLALQVQDFLNAVLFAWFEPVYRLAFQLRLKYTLEMFAWVSVALLLFALGMISLKDPDPPSQSTKPGSTKGQDMIWLGTLGVICALIPVHLGERHIIFQDFGRFSLPASVGAVMVLAGLWQSNSKVWWRWIMPTLFIFLASMAHYANARTQVDNWETVKDFWWQVSWRIPQIEPKTVLVINYPDQGIAEDYFVWGPANLIYYPTLSKSRSSSLNLLGATLNLSDLQAIQIGLVKEINRRGFSGQVDYSRTLVMSMPGEFSCVHVLDGAQVELSYLERPEIALIAAYSHPELIVTETSPQMPPAQVFGREPAHGWCYYYQQASLARQRADWAEVVRLGDEVQQQELRASDWIEWLPFLEGYAYQGIDGRVAELSAVLREDLYIRHQACDLVLQNSQAANQYPEGHQLLVDFLCIGR